MNRIQCRATIKTILIGITLFLTFPSWAQDESPSPVPDQSIADRPMIVLPLMDGQRGRLLFASKGCVLCHSINGVGGKLGPSLDASEGQQSIDVLDFAARMWRGAFAMAEFQAIEIGYQIELEGDELGDLAAFVYDIEQQRTFSEAEIPDLIKEWIVKQPYSLPDNLFE